MLRPGSRLAHYEVLSLIGAGGMGEVYRAEDTKLRRQIALKVLPQELDADATRRERFTREAQTVAALNHPNIVTLYSVEEKEGTHFLTMELVEGTTLSEGLSRGWFPLDELLRIAVSLADGVSAAHERGIVHRDLKPGNVMLSADGRVKILDFRSACCSMRWPPASGRSLASRRLRYSRRRSGTHSRRSSRGIRRFRLSSPRSFADA